VIRNNSEALWIVIILVIIAIMIQGTTDPSRTADAILQRLLHYGVLIGVAVFAISHDWQVYGPTIALKHGAVAIAIAWLLVVPFGWVTRSLLDAVGFEIALAALFVAVILCVVGGPFGMVIGAMLACLGVWLIVGSSLDLSSTLGNVLVFLATYWFVRRALGFRSKNVHEWPYVSEVHQGSEDYQAQCDFFASSCAPWVSKFDFGLRVKRLYRIDQPIADGTVPPASRPGARRLFHGTQFEGAQGIVCDGFRLPAHAGMFGRGLYFADCPLKCWRYCFPSRHLSEVMPRLTGRGGMIYMCWVDLGTVREEKEARPELTGYSRTPWRAWLTGQRGAYDAVKGVEMERGGALRVPEYVVYDPNQISLAYLFEVEKVAT